LIICVVVAVIIGAVITFFVSNSISKPIVEVTKDIRKKSELDFVLEKERKTVRYKSARMNRDNVSCHGKI
jgi:methyl-accepting chemotaxis protein